MVGAGFELSSGAVWTNSPILDVVLARGLAIRIASHELVPMGKRGRLGAGRYVQLGEDILEVSRDGVLADVQHLGDLPIAIPIGDALKDFQLARREAVFPGRPRCTEQSVYRALVWLGAKRLESSARGLELKRRRVEVV